MSRLNALHELKRHPLYYPLYLPSLIYGFSESLLLPVLPLYAADFDVSYELIGLLLAGAGIGRLIGDLPSGLILRRFGTRRVMMGGVGGMVFFTLALVWAHSLPEAVVYRILVGFSSAHYMMARHDYIARSVTVGIAGGALLWLAASSA
jgi:MFS family permease